MLDHRCCHQESPRYSREHVFPLKTDDTKNRVPSLDRDYATGMFVIHEATIVRLFQKGNCDAGESGGVICHDPGIHDTADKSNVSDVTDVTDVND